MKLDEYFSKYPDNIFGFRVVDGNKIIDFMFDNKWEFLQSKTNDYATQEIKKYEDKDYTYHILYSTTLNFEELFKALSKMIEFNINQEKKQKLFSEKINELKKLFTSMDYEELKEIKFNTPTLLNQGITDPPVDTPPILPLIEEPEK